MNGIFLAIDANHLDRANAQLAVAAWNKLQLSVGVCNFYINDAVEHDEDERVPALEDAEIARHVLGLMIHTGIKKKTERFSLAAYNEFVLQASKGKKPIEFISLATLPSVKEDEIEFDIGPKTDIEKLVEESTTVTEAPKAIKMSPATQTKDEKKTSRGRKFNADSPSNRSVELFRNAPSQKRDVIIALFQKELDLPFGTAQTYFYNACKKLGLKPSQLV